MRNGLYTAILLLLAGTTQAAPVTIDFEEPISSSIISGGAGLRFESKGYWITTRNPDYPAPSNYYSGIMLVSGNHFFESSDFVLFGDCYCKAGGFSFERADGAAFAVESANISVDTFGGGRPFDISGVTGNGTNVQLSLNTIGTGDWLNLRSFQVGINGADSFTITADNIVVSAVPIPAAVWLFASGLGVLGWIKRKRVA